MNNCEICGTPLTDSNRSKSYRHRCKACVAQLTKNKRQGDKKTLPIPTHVEADEKAVLSLYDRALSSYGIDAQKWMLVEECGELLNAIAKLKRGRSTKEEIVTELADVHIMVEQMAFFFGWDEFKAEKERKLERLKSRLENTGKDHSADKHEMVSEDFELFEKQYMNENESEIISVYDRHAGLVDGAKWQREQMKKGAIGTTDYPNDEELWCGFR